MLRNRRHVRGFSLLELVVVIVIIGILAAIAVPRLSRGSTGASQSAVTADLATVRQAIAMYALEHKGAYPGADAAGFVAKLTSYTDIDGGTATAKDGTHIYGPYLATIPPCPVGEAAGKASASDVLIDTNSPPKVNTAGGEGWVYNPTTGEFIANSDLKDEAGNKYSSY